MLFVGRRLQLLKKTLIDGYAQVPYLYFTMIMFAVGSAGVYYRVVTNRNNCEHNSWRHKHQYTVVRPDDPRLAKYPRKYLTDLHILEDYERRVKEKQQ